MVLSVEHLADQLAMENIISTAFELLSRLFYSHFSSSVDTGCLHGHLERGDIGGLLLLLGRIIILFLKRRQHHTWGPKSTTHSTKEFLNRRKK
jgi:hypothetical protein